MCKVQSDQSEKSRRVIVDYCSGCVYYKYGSLQDPCFTCLNDKDATRRPKKVFDYGRKAKRYERNTS